MVATVLRLRYRVLFNTLVRSPWQLVGFIFGGLWALGALLVLVAGLVVLAIGQGPDQARTVVVLGMTATLSYFAWRAARGWRWAYQRLRLFAQIFPVITLVMAAVPGLYPTWMITEQIVFSLIMIGIGDFLTGDHLREVFRKPRA